MQKLLPELMLLLLTGLFINACTTAPSDIEYGEDQCHACKMMIADSRFGAELVTAKGKIQKFDAIECLVPELNKHGEDHYAHIMVTNFNQPGTLIDATKSTFLISNNRPSPMGGFLSAYASASEAEAAEAEYKGQVFSWENLKKQEQFK